MMVMMMMMMMMMREREREGEREGGLGGVCFLVFFRGRV